MKSFCRLLIILFSVAFISCAKKTYCVGDIVMTDGRVLAAAELEAYRGKAEPVAVIFSVTGGEHEESKRVLGLGLKVSEPLVFAAENSKGYGLSFKENYSLVAAQEFQIETGRYSNAGFYGLVDGRNTWRNVAKYDSKAKKSFADYPAYEYAVNYGRNNNFKKFEKGWYLPTAAEARMLALSSESGIAGMVTLPDFIWTSSQSYDAKENELVVNLISGSVETGFKDMGYRVCSIYCFAE